MNKYLWAAAAGALLIWGAFTYHMIKVHGAEVKGYEQGMRDERLVWQVRENHELNAKNALINELQTKYRDLERKHAEGVEVVVNGFNIELKRLRNERDKALAAARDGMDFRLRWAASCAPTRKDPGGGSTSSAGADPGSAGGAAVCELPRETTENLIRLASEADGVVAERNALLEVAKKDREVCR